MTRINTNVGSLVAQNALQRTHNDLNTALTRLSTGLRINSGKDDPAGLIASEVLGSDITSINKAISNTQRANQLIGTADSALGQVSSLLNDIRGLVSDSANTGALSADQIAANQLQVDSSLAAIDRISQTTAFQGRRLLDGSLDFLTGSVGTADLKASGTFGAALDVNASGTVGNAVGANASAALTGTATAGGSVTFTALTKDPANNGIKVNYVIASGSATTADYNTGSKTLTVTLSAGASAANVVTAVNASSTASAVLSATASTAGVLFTSTAANGATASGTLAGGNFANQITLSAVHAGSAYNSSTVTFTDSATLGQESAAYDTASNTLSISKNANSTVSQVIGAINASGAFSASTLYSGQAIVTAGTTNSVTSGGINGNKITLSAINSGPAYNNVSVSLVDSAATGAEAATYSTATNTLTIAKHANSTANQLVAAINASGVFSASTAQNGLGTISAGTSSNVTTGGATGSASVSDLKISQANFGTGASLGVKVDVDTQAKKGELTYSGGPLASSLVLQIGGSSGFQTFNFGSGTTVSQIVNAVNQVSDATGVTASLKGSGIDLNTNQYGSDAFVSAKALSGSFLTNDASGAVATRVVGSDVKARINGVEATGKGLKASLSTATLDVSFTVNSAFTDGSNFNFNITGGGANFQLGPDVVSNQQARLGLQGVSTATLGGVSGKLFELRSGGGKDLSTDVKAAAKIVDEVITSVTGLRGRLGAFQKTTLDTNIATLSDTLANLTDAQSSIRDADFAAESAKLTRAQILVQSGTSVLQLANSSPQQVLALLPRG